MQEIEAISIKLLTVNYMDMNQNNLPETLNIKKYQIVSGEEAIRIALRWLAVFCQSRTSFKGILRHKSYMWDLIDCHFQAKEAIEKFDQHQAPKYVLMEDCFGQDDKELYIIDEKPDNSDLQDFHVFPKNLAWNMAFTHEDGWIGPNFTMNHDYEVLNRKNEKAMRALSGHYGK